MDPTNPLHLILAIIAALALLALIIGIIVFLVKPSSRRDSFRLAVPLHLVSRKNKKNHIFLGISEYSRLLAAQILQEWKKEKNKKEYYEIKEIINRKINTVLGEVFSEDGKFYVLCT